MLLLGYVNLQKEDNKNNDAADTVLRQDKYVSNAVGRVCALLATPLWWNCRNHSKALLAKFSSQSAKAANGPF
ncbi:hypothetical protein PG994_004050 [Apiospora phragmitis]|uniref:Uncharacterized protein n=1 Tax=Apiospora phragmitis TaxID=2905665 RepID=A0ABR1VZZ2_9PEZI